MDYLIYFWSDREQGPIANCQVSQKKCSYVESTWFMRGEHQPIMIVDLQQLVGSFFKDDGHLACEIQCYHYLGLALKMAGKAQGSLGMAQKLAQKERLFRQVMIKLKALNNVTWPNFSIQFQILVIRPLGLFIYLFFYNFHLSIRSNRK